MRLPQEICDLIIDQLAEDNPTLCSCALVSKRWVHHSRVHLFRFIILGGKQLQTWLDTFSPSDERIHSLAKGLILSPPANGAPLSNFLRIADYAPAFKNLEHFLLNGMDTLYQSQQFSFIRWFGHLRNTLKSLELCGTAVHPRIITAFPRLEYLLFQSCTLPSTDDPEDGDDIPEPSNDALRGTLEFSVYSWDSEGGLFAVLSTYPLGYDTIKIDVKAVDGEMFPTDIINRLISCCSETLEVLDIKHRDDLLCKSGPARVRSYPPQLPLTIDAALDLSPFERLREISLALNLDRNLRANLPRFSTITSGKVSKIAIEAKFNSRGKELFGLFGKGHEWTEIDRDLLRLAESQGGNNAQPVELVIDLRQANVTSSRPNSQERKRFERNLWVERASKRAFPGFSQTGKIDFVLPLPVSIPVPHFDIFTYI